MDRPMRARVTHLEEFVAKMFHLEKASAAVDAVDQQEEIPWRSVIIRVENGSDIYTTYTGPDFNLHSRTFHQVVGSFVGRLVGRFFSRSPAIGSHIYAKSN